MQAETRQIGYCTNVHAGADLSQTRDNLQRHAIEVKRQFSPDDDMGVGLWLSYATAQKLLDDRQVEEFAGWLRDEGLVPFTLNGFPYGDFHQPVVKHLVYQPTWYEKNRLTYTLNLIEILNAILPAEMEGSISTLPIAWGLPRPADDLLERAGRNLVQAAESLRRLEQETGRLIYICIEPEPGCVMQYSLDVTTFFEKFLFPAGEEATIRRYLRVCHDVCHAAVMFESQDDVLQRYQRAGIEVGKVQVSSAVHLPLQDVAADERQAALQQLTGFAEDRYLHQTVVRSGGVDTFYEDLPIALQVGAELRGELRVHFHVPIYLAEFGLLRTSRPQIGECLTAAARFSNVKHFEVETYAWGVLPPELQQPDLASGIAEELTWFAAQ